MTVDHVDQAIALCENHPDGFFAGPRSELIAHAEAELGFPLPASYQRFIEKLGAGSIGAFEVYGLTRHPFSGFVPDAVGITLRDRSGPSRLPPTMVVIGNDGMGGDFVLDVAKGSDPPVEIWIGGSSSPDAPIERISNSFGEWLLESVRQEIRT